MPRTIKEAEGWSLVNSDCLDGTGRFHGHRYVYPGDKSHSLIFDTNGIIAGVQTYVRNYYTNLINLNVAVDIHSVSKQTIDLEMLYSLIKTTVSTVKYKISVTVLTRSTSHS